MFSCAGAPDPFYLADAPNACHKNPAGLAVRSRIIDPAKKTLVLITTGQSIWMNVAQSASNVSISNVPVNSSVVDQFNVWDGNIYEINGSLLGCSDWAPTKSPAGYGNIACGVADKLVTAGKFDRVIIAALAIGGSSSAQWGLVTGDTGGLVPNLYGRASVAIRRLAAIGITPSTPGITFAHIFGCGESDNVRNTDPADYAANVEGLVANMTANGFVGRTFVTRESHYSGATNANVQAGQALLWTQPTFYFGGDLDALDNSYRFDTTHPSDTGLSTFVDVVVAALASSGAPF